MGCESSQDVGETGDQEVDELNMEFNRQRYDKNGNLIDPQNNQEKSENFTAQNAGDGEQFMAVKPWIGAIKPPSNPPQVIREPPKMSLTLQHVNGYRIEDARQNLFFNSSGNNIVFMAAALGIVMDPKTLNQQFFGAGDKNAPGHNDDITSLAICPQRKLVATGQLGKSPKIFIWNSETMEIVSQFNQGRDTRQVKCIKFSADGKYVYTVDQGNDINVRAFNVSNGNLEGMCKTGQDPIYDLDSGSGSFCCAVAGKRGLQFFSWPLALTKGLFSGNEMNEQISIQFHPNGQICYSGDIKGNINIWQGNQCSKQIPVHQGGIHSIYYSEGKLFTSGAKDQVLKIFDDSIVLQQEIKLTSYARSIDCYKGKMLLGCRNGTINIIENGQLTEVMNTHNTGEAWGLAVNENTGNVYTSCDDNKIIVFNPKTKKTETTTIINQVAGKRKKIGGASTLSVIPPNQQSRGLAINAKLGHLAFGVNDGQLQVRNLNSLSETIFENKLAKEWIECLSYSPNGDLLAVGSHDNNIYVYDANNQYQIVSTCKAHNSFITSVDWSTDGQFLKSVCGAYELLFHDARSGAQIKGGATQFRDEQWATYTGKFGWHVNGIFPIPDGSHINGVNRSNDKSVIVTADDWGLVNLYNYPNEEGSKCNSYKGHSSHVVRATFTSNDSHLFSIGGYDKCLMVWKVNK